jgi:hypothetical protein
MGNKSRRKLASLQATQQQPQSIAQDKLIINFSYENAWQSLKVDDFTNLLKDSNDFVLKHREVFSLVSYILKTNTKQLFHERHCNIIKDQDIRDLIKKILIQKERQKNKSLSPSRAESIVEQLLDAEIAEIGNQGGLRIFGLFKESEFIVLFIDYFHLIFPSQKHNQIDTSCNAFCPQLTIIK